MNRKRLAIERPVSERIVDDGEHLGIAMRQHERAHVERIGLDGHDPLRAARLSPPGKRLSELAVEPIRFAEFAPKLFNLLGRK